MSFGSALLEHAWLSCLRVRTHLAIPSRRSTQQSAVTCPDWTCSMPEHQVSEVPLAVPLDVAPDVAPDMAPDVAPENTFFI